MVPSTQQATGEPAMQKFTAILLSYSLFGCTTSFDAPDEDTVEDTDTVEDSVEDVVEDTVEDSVEDVGDEDGPCTETIFYRDGDADGYGREDDTVCASTAPPGYVAYWGDCCDTDDRVYPGQAASFVEPYTCPSPSFDYDCDGSATPEFELDYCPGLEAVCSAFDVDETGCRAVSCCYTIEPQCGAVSDIRRCGWGWAGSSTWCVPNVTEFGGCAEYGGGGEQAVACR
jgi:hypothetical protein